MNSTEFNKIAGAGLGALLVFLLLNFFSGQIYGTGEGGHAEEHVLAFALPIEQEGGGETEAPQVDLVALFSQPDVAAGEKAFRACTACHSTAAGENKVGPSLHNVVGRPVASIEGFSYSDAMAAHGGDWTPEQLFHFLENPKAWVPGTKMSFAGIDDPQEVAGVIAYLNQQGEAPVDLTAGLPVAEANLGDAAASGEQTAIPDPALSPGVGSGPGVNPPGEAAAVEDTAQAPEGVGAATAPGAAEGSVSEGDTAGGQVTGATIVDDTAEGADVPTSPAAESAEGEQARGEDVLQTGDPSPEAPAQQAPGKVGLPGEGSQPREGQPRSGTPEQAEAVPGPEAPSERVAGEGAPPQAPPGQPAAEANANEAQEERLSAAPAAPTPAAPTPAAPAAGGASAAGGIDFASADVAAGEKLFRRCAACHKMEEGRNGIGPSLWGVVGRPVAAVEGFNYSDAMVAHGGDWTPANLFDYLENPKAAVPGTKMAFPGLKDPQDRIDVIAYLNEHGGNPQPLQ